MAGDVNVATATGQAPTTAGNQVFNLSAGFGTPKAAKFFLTKQPTDGATSASDLGLSVGFTDGTNHYVASVQAEDASNSEDADRVFMTDQVVAVLDVAGAVEGEASFVSFTADTVTINWTNPPAAGYFVTCVAFAGADVDAVVGTFNPNSTLGGTTLVTTSIDQDMVFFASTDQVTADSVSQDGSISFGAATLGATESNACTGYNIDHSSNQGDPFNILHVDRCIGHILMPDQLGAEDWGLEVTAETTTSFTVTTRDNTPGGSEVVGYLALKLRGSGDTRGTTVAVAGIDAPILTGNWSPTPLSFEPQFVGLGVSTQLDPGIINSIGDIGFSLVAGSGQENCHHITDEDNAGTTNARSHYRSRAIWHRNESDVATRFDGVFTSFDAAGWTYNMTTVVAVVPRFFWYWAIEKAAAGFTGAIAMTSPFVAVAAVGEETFSGTATMVSPFVDITGTGLQTFSGSVAMVSPFVDVTAVGLQAFQGNIAMTAPFVDVAAVGGTAEPITGIIAMTSPFVQVVVAGATPSALRSILLVLEDVIVVPSGS